MIRVYIFQCNKTIDFFDTEYREVNNEIRNECNKLMNWAINEKRAEKGYYLVQIVNLENLFVLDSEDLIA